MQNYPAKANEVNAKAHCIHVAFAQLYSLIKHHSQWIGIDCRLKLPFVYMSVDFGGGDTLMSKLYTTNAVEGFHRMLRKYTKTKTVYPSDEAVKKSVYLSIQEITKKWTVPIANWGIIMGQMLIFFEDRLSAAAS